MAQGGGPVNRRRLLAIAVAVVLAGGAAVAHAGLFGPGLTAIDAVRTRVTQANTHDWAGAWADILPAQQALVPRAAFIACMARSAPPGTHIVVDTTTVTSTRHEPAPGTSQPLDMTDVTTQLSGTGPYGDITEAHTFTEAYVGGAWRTVLPADAVDRYQRGGCYGYTVA